MAEAVLNNIRNSRKAFTDIMNKYYIISERMESERKDQLIKEAKQEANEALRKQKISDYIIKLMTQGYSVDEARKLAEDKYRN